MQQGIPSQTPASRRPPAEYWIRQLAIILLLVIAIFVPPVIQLILLPIALAMVLELFVRTRMWRKGQWPWRWTMPGFKTKLPKVASIDTDERG
jgi:hypothetical protein